MPGNKPLKVVNRFGQASSIDNITSLDRVINHLPRAMGVELEVGEWGALPGSGGSLLAQTFHSNIVGDSSVKPSGKEIVLNPLIGDRFIAAMFELSEIVQKAGGEVNDTCALHVHVDASKLDWRAMRRVLMLYRHFEDSIFSTLISEERRQNEYGYLRKFDQEMNMMVAGMALTDSMAEMKDLFYKAVIGLSPGEFSKNVPTYAIPGSPGKFQKDWNYFKSVMQQERRNKYGNGNYDRARVTRYLGLNVFSWLYRGTIEWRMKEATLDPNELIYFPLFCGWFVEVANNLSDAKVKNIIANTPSLPHFINTFMPKFLGDWVNEKVAPKIAA